MRKLLFSIILIVVMISVFLTVIFLLKHDQSEPVAIIPANPQWNLPDGAKARFGKGSVEKIQYSPDGNVLAVVSTIGVWLYDAHTGELKSLVSAHSGRIADIAFTPDSQTIASGEENGTISLWDVSIGIHKKTLRKDRIRSLSSLTFIDNGQTLVSAADDYLLDFWDVATGKLQKSLNRTLIRDLPRDTTAFSQDGMKLAGESLTKEIMLWDVLTGEHSQFVLEYENHVSEFRFSPDGKKLASVDSWKTIHILDVEELKPLHIIQEDRNFDSTVAFSPDGKILARPNSDHSIHFWDTETGTLNRTITVHASPVKTVAFSPDGKTLASWSEKGILYLWDVATGEIRITITGHFYKFDKISLSPDGETIAIPSFRDHKAIQLWNATTGEYKRTLIGHKKEISDNAFSPDGTLLATASGDKTIILWDISTGERFKTIKAHINPITSIAFSPDGKVLASGDLFGIIRLWNTVSGKRIRTYRGHTGVLFNLKFSSDGKTLVSVDFNGTFNLWDVASGEQKKTTIIDGAETKNNDLSKLSPDFQSMAIALIDRTSLSRPDSDIGLWNVVTGERDHVLVGHTGSFLSMAFSADGKWLASSANEKTVRMWDVSTGEQKQTFEFQDLPYRFTFVGDIAFSPDGSIVACTLLKGAIYLWDSSTGVRKRILMGHTKEIKSLSFSADSNTLVSESKDGTILVWDLQPYLDPH